MKANYIPKDCHTVTPYLTVTDAKALVEFLIKAFNAVEPARISAPDGRIMHTQMRIGDSLVMIGEAQGPWRPMPCRLYVYVPDVDVTYKQAIVAGGTSVVEPTNMFYGDRSSCVKDMAGNEWWIATHIEELSVEEIQKRSDSFHEKMAQKPG